MRYSEWSPTQHDASGLGLPERQDWLVAPVMRTRDSEALDRSNFEVVLNDLGGESDTVEVHRFRHWGPGWFEIILVHPSRAAEVEDWQRALDDYPVADEFHYTKVEHEEAQEVWTNCFSDRERLAYIREHRSQFGFHDFANLMDVVRGRDFTGYASELLA